MHQGKLPELPGPDAPLPDYERPASPPQDASARPTWTRRLVLLLGLGAGAAVGYRVGSGGTARGEAFVPPGPAPADAPRGTLAWALGMRDAEPTLLLAAAGDLERVSMRHRSEADLVPLFVRILDLVVQQPSARVDAAAACAVRSLARHARLDLVRAREPVLAIHAEVLPGAHAAALALLEAGERRK